MLMGSVADAHASMHRHTGAGHETVADTQARHVLHWPPAAVSSCNALAIAYCAGSSWLAGLLSQEPWAGRNIWCCGASHPLQSKPISGGIPHCFPQFGPGEMQQHGFGRNLDWSVSSEGQRTRLWLGALWLLPAVCKGGTWLVECWPCGTMHMTLLVLAAASARHMTYLFASGTGWPPMWVSGG